MLIVLKIGFVVMMSSSLSLLISAIALITGSLISTAALAVEPTFSGVEGRVAAIDAPSSSDAYTLGAGDRIRVDIFQVPQYSGETEVLVDGTLNLLVVGRVDVRGLTLEQASEAIATQYSSILRRPIVTVTLIAPRQLQIGVAGEVENPGSYTISPTGTQLPRLTQVLEVAGGVRQAADLRHVEIHRPLRSGHVEIIAVDLWQLLQTGSLQQDYTLRDGDTIFIPTAEDIDLAESIQLSSASFAASETNSLSIAVVGEVFRPGTYTVTGTARTSEAGVPGSSSQGSLPSVTRAIQVAGGITPTADIRRVQVRRVTRSGEEQTFEVDLWQLLQGGDLSQDAILQDHDTVYIPVAEIIDPEEAAEIAVASFSPDSIRVNVVGEVTTPGVFDVPPNTPLNQALLIAGGFNNRASRESVQLVRLNPNGTVEQREVEIDFAQGIDDVSNPSLQNNDVIIVSRSGLSTISDVLGTLTDPFSRFFNLFSLPLNFLNQF